MWKRYLAFVMTIMLVMQTAPTAVYAGKRIDIMQNSINTVELGEKTENGEETENLDQTEQPHKEPDSESEQEQLGDENPEENSGEETASSEENTGQENPGDSTEEEQPAENPGEKDEPEQDQSEENADEEQLVEDVEQEEKDIEADEVEETEALENEEAVEEPIDTESSKLASVYATGSTGEYQPEGASYKLTYTEVTGGVKITGITGTIEGELKIPAQIDGMDVVEIGDNAFASCNKLTGNLILPSSVTVIGNSTFSGCDGLTGELVLPEGITLIGERAFNGCRGFTGKLNIPDNVNIIPDYTFDGCINILEVRIHKNVEKLGKYALRHGFYRRKTYIFNSNLEISSDEVGDYNLIYGYPGSAAEEYVKNNSKHNTFISLDNPLEIKEYRIKNTQELIDAIGPYRRIILADGLYDLEDEYFGIRNQIDLSIEAEHPGKAEVLSRKKTSPVIEIDSSMGVHISGCILGHESVKKGDTCEDHGYVIEVWNSNDIEINNCDLYGCGIWGISTVGSTITIEESVIRDCMEGIVKDGHEDIVSLRNCILSGNAYDDKGEAYPAFSCKRNLTVQDCIFLNNHNSDLICDENKASIDNCSFYNNVWDGGTPQPSGICLNGITWQMDGTVLKLGYPINLDNGTIESKTGKILNYSKSSLPWRNCEFNEVQYAEGILPSSHSYITLQKAKTVYECGETINLDDLTITYHDDETGISQRITEYTTNLDKIDMSIPGTKILLVTYNSGSDIFTEDIELTVIEKINGNNIASGEYQNIAWIINANGRLTVEGKGEFAPVNTSHFDDSSTTRAPWYEYRDKIISAEINIQDIYDTSYMFYGCGNLIGIDLSNFDTSRVSNMSGMFADCGNLSQLDLSNFDTSHVSDMSLMFKDCENLSRLDLSNFDTSYVSNMIAMFSGCENLSNLAVNNFDTSRVSNMFGMFGYCRNLSQLDLSNFDTSRVSDMSGMFRSCRSLSNLNVSSFDTSHVSDMSEMFQYCGSLDELDLSSFDASLVRYENELEDESAFMFKGCDSLNTIYTPYNLKASYQLPVNSDDVWYQPNGTKITTLPRECGSMIITRNKIPTVSSPYIRAVIRQINYICGDHIAINELTVQYHALDGSITNVTDYITNENEIDMSTPGKKTLVITYNELTTEIQLNVSASLVENIRLSSETLTLSVDETATLNVEITPDSAADAPVTWTSSDTAVATVEDELVTAISSGECTITASAGNKSASCLVTVTDGQADDDIASGNYENVRWKIDVNGKLTVEGNGDFTDSNSTDRAPWFKKRSAIKSAEINLTGTTNAAYMFYDCQNLADIDMSRFDVGNVTSFTGFFDDCQKLATIHVPCRLKESVMLPESDPFNIWCDTEGNTYTELPQNLDHSIILTRTQKPVTLEPYIELNKEKTSYIVGEQLNTDDLEVTYYDKTGTSSQVSDYTTNANEIDMSTPGIKTLVVTYQNLTAEIEITVSEQQPEVERGLKILFKNEQDQEVAYTGNAMKPELKVSYNGRPLTEGTNYTVKYSNNVKVGNAKITVTGIGNFKSSKTEYFKIVQADIANAEFAGTDQEGQLVVVQGSKFAPVIYCGNRKLSTNDYSLSGMIQAGKKITDGDSGKVITIKGKGNYTGSKEITLKVVRKNNLTKFTVTLDKTKLNALTYDGRAHYIHEIQGALKVTGKDGNTNMQRGIDYMVMYPANVTDAGTKKISVVGMGLYTGTVSKSYTIKPAVNTSGFVNVEYESGNIERIKLPYRSTGVTFNDQIKVTYTKDGNTLLLKEGKDYKLTYSGNKKVGSKAKFTISFLGNYKGMKKQTRMFTIEKADLENASVVIADAVYKKKPGIYKSVPYLIEPETGRLINASNYKVSYYIDETRNIEMKGNNKVSSGDIVYVKIEAKANGNYRSNTPIVKTYRVADAINLSNVKISFIDAKTEYATKTAEYTGHKITDQEIKVLINGKRADEDVVITYANNIAKGKATVIITGTGKPGCKYTGCKKATFNIAAYSLR